MAATLDDSAIDAKLEDAMAVIAAHFDVALGDAARVSETCAELGALLSRSPERAPAILERALPLLSRRRGAVAAALFEFLVALAERMEPVPPCAFGLASCLDADLARRGLACLASLVARDRLEVTLPALQSLAEGAKLTDPTDELTGALRPLVAALSRPAWPTGATDAFEALALAGSVALRSLAARLLDERGSPSPDFVARSLAPAARAVLAPYLDFTRATHADLVALTPAFGLPPPIVPSLQAAEAVCGARLTAELVGELGWASVSRGLDVSPWAAVRVDGSLPFCVAPDEVELLHTAGACEAEWTRFLVVAHGGEADSGRDPEAAAEVQRLRQLNVLHAEALAAMLELAPLLPSKVARIMGLVGEIAASFHLLFASRDPEVADLPALWSALSAKVARAMEGAPADAPLGAETTRLVLMFEDPRSLADVRTVHGLKRYLHQHGLRLAFKLFRSGAGGSRTVDLAVASARRVLGVWRCIRFLDFEPPRTSTGEASLGDRLALPRVVAMAAEAFGRQALWLEGRPLPSLRIFVFGNEVQLYASFRNHPAFIRVDLSPPLRGGMVDLEYYAVSQFELEHHPDLSLQGMQRFFRALDFEVRKDGLKLRARFDKERAHDLGELLLKLRALLALVPHLMEVDWAIASLDYPAESRPLIAAAWADRFVAWARLPLRELTTSDGRRVLLAVEPGPGGERELAWDGVAPYADRRTGKAASLFSCLRAALEARALDGFVRWREADVVGQVALERAVLSPLRAARARGEVVLGPAGLARASGDGLEREHAVDLLARVLDEGGAALHEAIDLARLVGVCERHLAMAPCGAINGYEVHGGELPLQEGAVGLYVLRDADELPRLAVAVEGGVLLRSRGSPAEPWVVVGGLSAAELTRRLRRDNYLDGSAEVAGSRPRGVADQWRVYFATVNPHGRAALHPGARALPATPASPGRESGLVRFAQQSEGDDLDDAVLVAPALRPEDAPRLARAQALVATGGGVLSHAGLIALELGKPSVVVVGRWSLGPGSALRLSCERPDFVEERGQRGPFALLRRRALRVIDEPIEAGDLVVVDGDAGCLTLLGQAPAARVLHAELRRFDAVSARLEAAVDDERLMLRGEMLRTVHALERIFRTLEREDLVRHATRVLVESAARAGASVLTQQVRLLRVLLERGAEARPVAGPDVAAETSAVVAEELATLQRRRDALCAQLQGEEAAGAFELLALRLELRRVEAGLQGLSTLLGASGFGAAVNAGCGAGEVERRVRDRLVALREARATRLVRSEGTAFERRAALRAVDRIDGVLGDGGSAQSDGALAAIRAQQYAEDAEARRRASARRVLAGDEVVGALADIVGAKAANLAEVGRVPPCVVPCWFVVTDRAFRELLDGPVGRGAAELAGAASTLGDAIRAVLQRSDWPPVRKSGLIRELWRSVPLPPALAAELAAAYRGLRADAPDEGEPFVAVRSSSLEEDAAFGSAAGRFDTFLYVRSEAAVLEHLRLAFAGLWTERALAQPAVAPLRGGGVIVQRIVNARVSGVLHTIDAAGRRFSELTLNVGLGLGEGVVSGLVEVDQIFVAKDEGLRGGPLTFRYRVGDKREQTVFDARAGHGTHRQETRAHQRLRPALEYVELQEIVRAAAALESAFCEPLDIELAIEGSQLFILQARPIALHHATFEETQRRHPLGPRGPALDEGCRGSSDVTTGARARPETGASRSRLARPLEPSPALEVPP